jgi:Protein of unknown function (DUF3108)
MLLALLLAAVCPPQKLQAARFTMGEVLSFKLDVLGVEAGTFEVRTARPAGKEGAIEITSRARTSAFVSSNVARYEAYASALLGRDFSPLHYREDVDEGETHRGTEVAFPPAAGGALPVKATKNGEPESVAVAAGPEVRDILSALFVFRAQPMRTGTPVCMEVFAGRKIWKVTGKVAARETIDTPLGKMPAMRIDADSVRTDDARVRRSAHVWVSDDERRLPLVALGEMRGKVIRATLTSASGARRASKP